MRLFPEGLDTQRLPAFKELNARFTKGFALGGLDLTGYLDVRNLLNFRNVLQVLAVNGNVHAEQRFGDGDGIYTVEEQSAAINALYDVARGQHQHLGVGRRARIGFEIDF